MSRARIAVTSNMRSGVEPLNGQAPFSKMPIGPDLTTGAGSGVVFSAIVGSGSDGSLSMSVGSVTVVSVAGTVFDAVSKTTSGSLSASRSTVTRVVQPGFISLG